MSMKTIGLTIQMFSFRFAHEQVANSAEEFASAKNLSYGARLYHYGQIRRQKVLY